MEKFMFDRMIAAALARRIRRIVGVYRPTGKNGLVKELYDQVGFRRIKEELDEVRYELQVPAQPTVTATHIRDVSAKG
jgi:predicted enzyme involved in methoxymalonyl-ACP biosynthesis